MIQRMLTCGAQARVLYMHRFGGMYADLDMEALRDLGPILGQETRPVFSAMQVLSPCQRVPAVSWVASSVLSEGAT